MTRFFLFLLAGVSLGLPAAGSAQSTAAPGNVVAPPPAPREGTVGPEQLRDFALPGTRQQSPPPAEAPRPAAPSPAPVATPAPRTTAPATATRSTPTRDVTAEAVRDVPEAAEASRPAAQRPAPASEAPSAALLPGATPAPVDAPSVGQPLPPITVTVPREEAPSLLPGWWPWVLVAVLAGVGLAVIRRRRRPAFAGHEDEGFRREAVQPSPPSPSSPAPAPQPSAGPPPTAATPLPTGLVTTRLRQPSMLREASEPVAAPPAVPVPAPTVGGIVSTRLRAWVELDLHVREIQFEASEAVLLVDLIIANSGSSAARDIALEAVIMNGGESQGTELATFFERPAAERAALAELGPLNDSMISHELRLPREAIRAYDVGGKAMFVPVVAITASYRTGSGAARTGAAFLVGRAVAGSEKLAPLPLPVGTARQSGLGTRRLEEAVRR